MHNAVLAISTMLYRSLELIHLAYLKVYAHSIFGNHQSTPWFHEFGYLGTTESESR
jgi:hypothetical protein